MQGINFSFSGDDAFDDMIKAIQSIYLESDSWDFKVEITKEKETYNVWIREMKERYFVGTVSQTNPEIKAVYWFEKKRDEKTMQKTVKITIAIIVILAIAAAIIYNTNIPAASTNSTDTPIFNVLPSFDKQPTGNSTIENSTSIPQPSQITGNFTLIEIKEPKPEGTEYVFTWRGPATSLTYQKDGYVFTQSIDEKAEISITFKNSLKIYDGITLLIDIHL